jgi:hypothetical protein
MIIVFFSFFMAWDAASIGAVLWLFTIQTNKKEKPLQ